MNELVWKIQKLHNTYHIAKVDKVTNGFKGRSFVIKDAGDTFVLYLQINSLCQVQIDYDSNISILKSKAERIYQIIKE